jgi:Yip1 domain
MTVQDQPSVDLNGIIARVKAILLGPAAEWDRIEAEPATIRGLYLGYILVLAAIGPVSTAFGGLVFGYGTWLVHYRPSVSAALSQAILGYLLSLVMVFVLGLIIDALAPSFDGQKNRIQAFKVATYSMTASWVAGVFGLVPALSFLGILGLYGFYLLYLGLPRLMKSPPDKALVYTLVTVVAAIILWFVAAAILVPVAGLSMLASMAPSQTALAPDATGNGTVEINGERIDLNKLQSAANQLGTIAKQFQQGTSDPNAPPVAAVSTEALKALLPESLGGYTRSSSESGAALGTVHAEATYSKDGKSIKLSVIDLAAAGAFAQLAAAFGIESDQETANGFDKVGRVNGVLTMQQWDRPSLSGKYSVMLADRFIIDAEGQAASFDDLKAAVAAVGPDRVLRLK